MKLNNVDEIIAEITRLEFNKPCGQYVEEKKQQNIPVLLEDVINQRAQFLQDNKDLLYANIFNPTINAFLDDLRKELTKQKEEQEKKVTLLNPTQSINTDVINFDDPKPTDVSNNNAVDVVTQVSEMPQFTLTRNKPGEIKYNYEDDDRINSVAGYASIVLLVLTSILLATYVIASIIGA